MHSSPIQMPFNNVADITQFDLVNSRTCPMKFKDFQAPALFSSTFKALNLGEKNSSTFKDFQGCVGVFYQCHCRLVQTQDHFHTVGAVKWNMSRQNLWGITGQFFIDWTPLLSPTKIIQTRKGWLRPNNMQTRHNLIAIIIQINLS